MFHQIRNRISNISVSEMSIATSELIQGHPNVAGMCLFIHKRQ